MATEVQTGAIVPVGEVVPAAPTPVPAHLVVDTQTRQIGLIIPPPDIRAIVDKTAEFVAKNGTDFEKKILAQPKSTKFNFLQPTDPYNKYYKYKIMETQEGPEAAKAAFQAKGTPGAAPTPAPAPAPAADAPPPTQELEKPTDELYTVHVPAGLTSADLDVIKLTAQFVARNGKQFMSGLLSREQHNPQFYFLKPTHSLFTFFTQLTDAYSRVLLPSKDLKAGLERDVADRDAILARCLRRLEWTRAREAEADEAAAERERERMAMLVIDWHDFTVVRTIEFDETEDETTLPPPLTLKDVIQMNKAGLLEEEEEEPTADGARAPGGGAIDGGAVGMDAEEAALVAQGQEAPPPPPMAPESKAGEVVVEEDDEDEGPIKVVKDYKRTPAGQQYDPTRYVVSPITGELVPLAEMQEHMRINLIDPKWKDQREVMLAKIKETTKASDVEIMSNLTRLAGTRPDVFGSSSEELSAAIQQNTSLPKDGPAAPPKTDRSRPPPLQLGPAPIGTASAPSTSGRGPTLAPLPANPRGVGAAPLPPAPPRPMGLPPPPSGQAIPSLNSAALPGPPRPQMPPPPALVPPRPMMPAAPSGMPFPGVLPPPPGGMAMPMSAPPGMPRAMPPPPPAAPAAPMGALPGAPGPPVLGQRPAPPASEEPEAKRRKQDGSVELLPEAQSLSQHPGPQQNEVQGANDGDAPVEGQSAEQAK